MTQALMTGPTTNTNWIDSVLITSQKDKLYIGKHPKTNITNNIYTQKQKINTYIHTPPHSHQTDHSLNITTEHPQTTKFKS